MKNEQKNQSIMNFSQNFSLKKYVKGGVDEEDEENDESDQSSSLDLQKKKNIKDSADFDVEKAKRNLNRASHNVELAIQAKVASDKKRAMRKTQMKKKNASELLSYSNAKWVEKQKEMDKPVEDL